MRGHGDVAGDGWRCCHQLQGEQGRVAAAARRPPASPCALKRWCCCLSCADPHHTTSLDPGIPCCLAEPPRGASTSPELAIALALPAGTRGRQAQQRAKQRRSAAHATRERSTRRGLRQRLPHAPRPCMRHAHAATSPPSSQAARQPAGRGRRPHRSPPPARASSAVWHAAGRRARSWCPPARRPPRRWGRAGSR